MSSEALVKTAVAQIRVEPDQRSELFSQATLGHRIRVIERKKRWVNCGFDDKSQGWVHEGSLSFVESIMKLYGEGPLLTARTLLSRVLSEPAPGAYALTILTDGSLLSPESREGEWWKVLLPDNRIGWIPSAVALPDDKKPRASREAISRLALAYLGIPYLWGGTSTLALDCSGLTQLVYRLHGTILPRNSFEQADSGSHIEPGANWENLQSGDLLFFAEGERVDHVALSLGGAELVHASMSNGCVAREALDPDADSFSERLANMFHSARRVHQNC